MVEESVPQDVKNRADKLALELVKEVDHTMRLEGQGIPWEVSKKQAEELAKKLIRDKDPRVWEP